MPTFNTPMLTDFGRDLLGRVNAGKTKVTYTKAVFSSMDNSDKTDDDIKKMKDITPAEITSAPSTNYEDGNTVEVRAIGTNRGLTNSVAINTYATYAKDDNGNEAPFAIAVSQSPDYMPADSGQAITNLTFSILFTVQDTKNINFNDPHNEAPTYQDIADVNNRIDGIQGVINDTLKPYDEQITDNKNGIATTNNRIDSLNNGKADKDDVTNKWNYLIGSKANKSELDDRITSLNNGKTDKAATDNKINTVNSRIDSLNNGKADKYDTYSKSDTDNSIKTAMNQANSHSDGHYNDLSNKNDILSNQLNSNTNNINDKIDNLDIKNLIPEDKFNVDIPDWIGLNTICSVNLIKNKKYCFSANLSSNVWGFFKLYIVDNTEWSPDSQDYSNVFMQDWQKHGGTNDNANGGGSNDVIRFSFIAPETKTYYVRDSANHFSLGNTWHLSKMTLTQTDDYVPFEYTNAVISGKPLASKDYVDNQSNQLSNKTDNLSQQIKDSHTDLNNAKADKYNTYTKNDIDAKVDNVNSRVTDLNNGKADKTGVYGKSDIDSKINNLNDAKADKYNSYTKDDVDTRITWAKSELNNNKQDKSDSTNKYEYLNTIKANTDDMNNHIQGAINQANNYTDQKLGNSHTDLNNAKADKVNVYSKSDVDNKIASMRKNSWHWLSTSGDAGSDVMCKLNDNGTATIVGNVYGGNNQVTVYSSDDFNFTGGTQDMVFIINGIDNAVISAYSYASNGNLIIPEISGQNSGQTGSFIFIGIYANSSTTVTVSS